MEFQSKDEFLTKLLKRYDTWMSEGKIPSASKVIPVGASLQHLQWVLPTNQAIEILRNARSFAVKNCICRAKYQRCDHPLEVCLVINDYADLAVDKGEARRLSLDEAVTILELANQRGLMHLTLYNPEQHICAVCSCCDCCCHQLQIMKLYQRPDLIAHSDYIASVDTTKCSHCGKCVQRCVFGAQLKTDQVEYHPEYCYGCGLCVTSCPAKAISLKLR
ncbi:MAG TPA: 4Fe-4S binding protein [Bacillota bacterium]|nr:4Fe-4S binding protein [Bacillota bacterium]